MKKLYYASSLVLMLLALVFSGCTAKLEAFNDTSKTIQTKVSQEFVIALGSNLTTGYSWQPEYDGGMFTLVNREYKADDTFGKYVVGSGGTEYFYFKANTTGHSQISFTYYRPWENPNSEDQKAVFDIVIK
ncbi:MAG: protease inhibitor I42 family protein [Dehalogenimonas sp.]